MAKGVLHNSNFVRVLQVGLLIIFCFLSFYTFVSGAALEQATLSERTKTFEHELEHLRQKLNIPGMSAAVLHRQKIMFARGFGYADLQGKIPATENTPYHIASLTKPFAAVLIMQFVETGQLNLDSAMAELLKDFTFTRYGVTGYTKLCKAIKKASTDKNNVWAFLFQEYHGDTERITVKHHLTHTSQGVPGEAYRYNGFLYGLLTEVLEKVSEKPFDKLLVDRIIAPIGMSMTFPNQHTNQVKQILNKRAKPYQVDDAGNFVLTKYPDGLKASAGMVSTVLDLAKFDVAMERNQLISEGSKKAIFTPAISSSGEQLPYGLGWFVQEHRGLKLVWHSGWQPDAYSSLILKIPKESLTLILLANSDGVTASFNLSEGKLLKSPFAVGFLNLLTNMEISSTP
ncbi:beta-lactamase family protein [bacterium]|nr:beta-lactamase family protein [bacterium]